MKSKKSLLSVMMFIQYAIQGAWFVTMGTYLGEILNFSGTQIGMAYGTAVIASIVSPFIIGMIADRFFSANRVLAFLNLIGATMLFWLSTFQTFSLFFPVLFIYTICFMPTMSLTNSISFANLVDPGKEFSRIRLFGSFGWIGVGFLISALKLEQSHVPFIIAGGLSLAGGLFAFMLPYKAPEKITGKVSWTKMIGFDAFNLTRQRSFRMLLIFSALACIPLSFYDSFTNLYMNNIGMKNTAAAMSMGQIAEIICLFTFPFFFAKLRYKGSIGLALLAWAILYGLFALGAYSGEKTFVFFALPLHGLCFTFFFVAGQLFADEKAPSNLQNSAQGLIAFATYGVGKYIGTWVAGKVVDHYTINGSYHWFAIWMVPFVIIMIVLCGFMIFFKEKDNNTQE